MLRWVLYVTMLMLTFEVRNVICNSLTGFVPRPSKILTLSDDPSNTNFFGGGGSRQIFLRKRWRHFGRNFC